VSIRVRSLFVGMLGVLALLVSFVATPSVSAAARATDSGIASEFQIRSNMNGKCLDVLGLNNSNGARVGVWDCTGNANQRWYRNNNEIRSSMNHKCLEILGFSNSNGAQVGMWDCTRNANQQWTWTNNDIRSNMNGKCLEILGFSNSNGAQAGMWDCTGGANQKWR
jgi:hypothetical protein